MNPSENLSCLLFGPGKAEFEERPIPSLENPRDVLIRIAYTGVCGSDVHFWVHGGINAKVDPSEPLIMGHEASGTVVAVGSKVTTFSLGDRVALEPGFPCRCCEPCKDGHYNFCPDMTFAASPGPGKIVHGTLTKFFRLPEDFCYKLPKEVGLDEGVLVEPMAVAIHCTRLVGVKPGDSVVVFGAGTVGLLCCAVAREFGAASVIAVDINDERLHFASSFAATGTYEPRSTLSPMENASSIIDAYLPKGGADIVIEASGAESSIQTGIYVARKGGAYVQTGLGRPMIAFPIVVMSEKELNMKGCFRYGPGDFKLAIDLLRRKRIDAKRLITQVVDFRQAKEAWEMTRKGQGIKTLIRGVPE